jgi:cholesterol oxidase
MTMTSGARGITFSETMSGHFALGASSPEDGNRAGEEAETTLAMHADVTIEDLDRFVDDPSHEGGITGTIDFAPLGVGLPAQTGVFNLFSPTDEPDMKHMVYEMAFEAVGKQYYLAGHKKVQRNSGFDLWSDTTTLHTTLHEGADSDSPVVGAGILSLGPTDLIALVKTARVTGAGSPAEMAATLAEFGQFFMGELWDTYGIAVSAPKRWWRKFIGWITRKG